MSFPKGIWYDAPNRRYRVRKYKNRRAYLAGYYDTFDEALSALSSLDVQLSTVATRKRGERREAAVPRARFGELARAAFSRID